MILTNDVETRDALEEAYGDVDAIDPWVGGISESHVPFANVGPLILAALRDQFIRSRDGDRFFWNRDPDLRQPIVRQVIDFSEVTFAQVIRWNTSVNPPDDMFFLDE